MSAGPSSAWCAISACGGEVPTSAPAPPPSGRAACGGSRRRARDRAPRERARARSAAARLAHPTTPARARLGEAGGDPGGVALGGGDQQRQIDDVAGDRRQIQQRSRLARQPIEPLPNDLPDPVGHLARHDRGRALLVAQVHHLVEKERVALGAVEDPRLDLRLDRRRRARARSAPPPPDRAARSAASSPRGRCATGARSPPRPSGPRRPGRFRAARSASAAAAGPRSAAAPATTDPPRADRPAPAPAAASLAA